VQFQLIECVIFKNGLLELVLVNVAEVSGLAVVGEASFDGGCLALGLGLEFADAGLGFYLS
jgi:hypothetical protein